MSEPWQLERSAVREIAAFNRKAFDRYPDLLRLKYQRMGTSPFAFFRGTDHLFYRDLHEIAGASFAAGPQAILQGDLHLSNFGTMPKPDGRLMIALNDFDEAYIGPVLLDVRRFAASVAIAGRENGFKPPRVGKLVQHAASRYYRALEHLADEPRAWSWSDHRLPPFIAHVLSKAERQDPIRWLDKRAPLVDGRRHFVRNERSRSVSRAVERDVRKAFAHYLAQRAEGVVAELSGYWIADVVSAVAGTGSVGRARYRLLLIAPDERAPIVLEMKEEVPAALSAYLTAPRFFREQADRFVAACQLMNGVTDPFMGTVTLPARDALESRSFFVRRLYAWKEAIDPTRIGCRHTFQDLVGYYAERMAASHAGGQALGLAAPCDLLASLGEPEAFTEDLVAFSQHYARQVRADYGAFVSAWGADPLLPIPPAEPVAPLRT